MVKKILLRRPFTKAESEAIGKVKPTSYEWQIGPLRILWFNYITFGKAPSVGSIWGCGWALTWGRLWLEL